MQTLNCERLLSVAAEADPEVVMDSSDERGWCPNYALEEIQL